MPVTPSTTTSGMPPVAVATMGLAAAIASRSDVPRPSVIELIDEDVEGLVEREDVGPEAGEEDMLLEAPLLDLPLERRSQLALAGDDKARVGDFADDERRGLDEVALTLVRHQRGDVADERGLMGKEQLFVKVGAAAPLSTRSRSMPSCTVTVRDSGTPSATSMRRIASDAQMKQSTCRYFHRDIAPLRKWKSTRREATSGGLASCVLIDSARPAIATPCGSWAWTMSGLSCLIRRDRRHAALRSISVFGASGMRSSPSFARCRNSPPDAPRASFDGRGRASRGR